MDYTLNSGILNGVFAVPNAVVDNYIKLANEASVKVLLYMLRKSGQSCTKEEISSAVNVTTEQVEEAFIFWKNANVFSCEEKNEKDVQNAANPPVEETEPATPVIKKRKKKMLVPDSSVYNISPSEISSIIENSSEKQGFFLAAEELFGKPTTFTQQRSFIYLMEYMDISPEVLLMIIAYSTNIGKSSVGYIETVAYDFYDRGLITLEKAQGEIKRLEDNYSFNGKVKRLFGIEGKLSKNQQTLIDEWYQNKYSFDMIELAYDRAVDAGKKATIAYINGTLNNWKNDGITTVEQAMKEIKAHAKKYSQKGNMQSFDINDLQSLVNNFGEV